MNKRTGRTGRIDTFYVKDKVDWWTSPTSNSEVLFSDFLKKYKFYTDSWLKTKIFNITCWVLEKIGLKLELLLNVEKTVVYKSYRISYDDINYLIRKHSIDLEYIWHERPQYLVIGQDTFYKLYGKSATSFSMFPSELAINMDLPYYDSEFDKVNDRFSYRTETLFWGFKVLVVPWIDGCFLLPNI